MLLRVELAAGLPVDSAEIRLESCATATTALEKSATAPTKSDRPLSMASSMLPRRLELPTKGGSPFSHSMLNGANSCTA